MIFVIIYVLFSIALAYLNYKLIPRFRIFHGINGGLHLIAAAAIGYFISVKYGVALLCLVRVFFDLALNVFRGFSPGYIDPDRIGSKISLVDNVEKWIVETVAKFIKTELTTIAIVFRLMILTTGVLLLIL